MTQIAGQRDTMNIETSRKKIDAEPKIALFDPQATPLVSSLFTIGREYVKDDSGAVKVSGVPLMKKATTNPRFDWWEDQLSGFKTLINLAAGYAAGDTSIVVDDGTIFSARDIVFVPRTGELMEVNGAPAGNTVTFRRGVGASGAGVALLDNDELILIGSAYPEGAASNSGNSTKEVNNFNYTQIQRTPIEETRTFSKTEMWTENDWAYQIKKQGIEHLKKLERMLWFGKREESTNTVNNTGGKPKRLSGGIMNFITTNRTVFSGTMTESDFHTFLEGALKNGSNMKYVFCSPRVLTVISNFAHGRLQTKVGEQIFGLTIHEYQSPHGMVKLVRQPLFDESAAYQGAMVAIDLKNLKYRFLQDSDVQLLDNRQANDVDGRKSEYLSESGLQFQLENEAAVATGITN